MGNLRSIRRSVEQHQARESYLEGQDERLARMIIRGQKVPRKIGRAFFANWSMQRDFAWRRASRTIAAALENALAAAKSAASRRWLRKRLRSV